MNGALSIKMVNLEDCSKIKIHNIHSFQWQIWGGSQDSMKAGSFAIKSQKQPSYISCHHYVFFVIIVIVIISSSLFSDHVQKCQWNLRSFVVNDIHY